MPINTVTSYPFAFCQSLQGVIEFCGALAAHSSFLTGSAVGMNAAIEQAFEDGAGVPRAGERYLTRTVLASTPLKDIA